MDQAITIRQAKNKSKIYSLAKCALGVALVTVSAYITVPGIGSSVPFTMQTFAVMCLALLLGAKWGSISMVVYIVLGAVGLPVFSGMRGGLGVLAGATGGYIIGFLPMVALTGVLYSKFGSKPLAAALSMAAGNAVLYVFGTAWFVLVYSAKAGSVGVITALLMCVVPYIVPDALKAVLALFVAKRTARALKMKS